MEKQSVRSPNKTERITRNILTRAQENRASTREQEVVRNSTVSAVEAHERTRAGLFPLLCPRPGKRDYADEVDRKVSAPHPSKTLGAYHDEGLVGPLPPRATRATARPQYPLSRGNSPAGVPAPPEMERGPRRAIRRGRWPTASPGIRSGAPRKAVRPSSSFT